MEKKRIYRYITWLWLITVWSTVVPVHQILHQHQAVPKIEKGSMKVVFKKTAKPCCKPFESFGAAVLPGNAMDLRSKPDHAVYLLSSTDYILLKPFYHFTNKAPPVSIA